MNLERAGLQRVRHGDGFASFPMVSADGSTLAFCESRNVAAPRDLHIFMADRAARR